MSVVGRVKKALGDAPLPPSFGVKMSLLHERGRGTRVRTSLLVEGVVGRRRVRGEAGGMPLAVTMREVIGIGGGSVEVMTDLIKGMIDLIGEGMMISMNEGGMVIGMSEGEMMIGMSEGEMMIGMSEGGMMIGMKGEMIGTSEGEMIVMNEGEMMIVMNEGEMMIVMSEGGMMIVMNEGEMAIDMSEGGTMTLTGEEVMIVQEMVGLREGGMRTEGMTTGIGDEMRTKEVVGMTEEEMT